jgi:hypothetical protein
VAEAVAEVVSAAGFPVAVADLEAVAPRGVGNELT